MTTYIDSHAHPGHPNDEHLWHDFTQARLDWIYGENRTTAPQSQADLASWNRLISSGRKVAA